jgi:putative FmdB family regulatory protein
MIYEYKCGACGKIFEKNVPISENKKPLVEPCPLCDTSNQIKRVFSSAIVSDYMDVQTRAKKVGGEAFTEVMSRIHKGAGKNSKMDF